MSERTRSIAADGLPGRYAAALFDLAREEKALAETRAALTGLGEAIATVPEFGRLISGRQVDGAQAAVLAVSEELGLPALVRRFLGVVGRNRRLAALPRIIAAFEARVDALEGLQTAQVRAAHPLSDAQQEELKHQLKTRTGSDMRLAITVDPTILGGLVVRVGSTQIDSSIRTRLERLAQQMKG
ncbi:MAG: F0F1 ATP synthase subunit delta [Thermaurantiacus sp.]